MTEVDLAYLNYRSGGLQGTAYNFTSLQRAVAPLIGRAPALFALCEGKRWLHRGSAGMNAACIALDDALGRAYVGLPGWHRRGEYGPAVVWDPQVLRLHSWTGSDHQSNALHGRNIAEFSLRGEPGTRLKVKIVHYAFDSGTERVAEAEQDADRAGEDVPLALVGDINSTASGAFLPQRDWERVPPDKRRHKAMLVDGKWVADTRALDILIGEHDGGRVNEDNRLITRTNGAGFTALAELAFAAGVPYSQAFQPTTNVGVDSGGPLIIDWLLANHALAQSFAHDSYEVHVPTGIYPSTWPLDHRLISARFVL